MADNDKHTEIVEELVAQFNLNDTIRDELLEATEFSIGNHKKQGHLLKVTGRRPNGSKFEHNVMWTKKS